MSDAGRDAVQDPELSPAETPQQDWRRARAALVLAVVVIGASAAAFAAAGDFPDLAARAPRLVAVAAGVTAAVVAAGSVRELLAARRAGAVTLREALLPTGILGRTTLVGAITAAYILVLDHAGFLLATAVFLTTLAFVLGVRRVIGLALVGPVTAVALYLLFVHVFGIRLPALG